jgi:hypothetical protein
MNYEPYDPKAIGEAPPDEQQEMMEEWFRARFEDPAERTPYDSQEGGYIWIWGGPYDAREELRNEFYDMVPEPVIDELVSSLERECIQWAPTAQPEDYDHGLYEAVNQNQRARQTLDEALSAIKALIAANVSQSLADTFRRLLFANAITALETFLSDTFINRVLCDQALLQAYIDCEPKFRERRVQFKDVLREAQNVSEEARKELLDVVWHNIADSGARRTGFRGERENDSG